MTNIIYDYILDELRLQDTSSVPDPLFVNNLGVRSLASINTLNVNQVFSSTATIGNVGLNNLQWNLTAGATTFVEGQMSYDANQQTTVLGMAGGNVNLALGMETLFPRRVRNSTGSTMPKGTAVYINGVSGNTPTIDRAIATGDQTSAYTIGLTAESIDDNATGWVATFGELTGIDLSAFTGGDTLYLSGVSAGLFTNTPQLAPFHYVRLGTVVKATSDGALVVNVINGFETNEIHDIQLSSLASGHILISNGSLWQNKSLATQIHQLNYKKYFGEYDEDPTITGIKNGDQYWNNLDERIQVYINRWRELNGADRFQFTNGDDFQFTDSRYYQFTR